MKLIELVNSVEGLNKILDAKLPASTGFKLAKLVKAINPEVETFYKIRNEKVVVYGDPVFEGEGDEKKETGRYNFSEENGKKFNDEIFELGEQEINIDIPEIKSTDLTFATIEPKYLMALEWLIKE